MWDGLMLRKGGEAGGGIGKGNDGLGGVVVGLDDGAEKNGANFAKENERFCDYPQQP